MHRVGVQIPHTVGVEWSQIAAAVEGRDDDVRGAHHLLQHRVVRIGVSAGGSAVPGVGASAVGDRPLVGVEVGAQPIDAAA